MYIYTLISLAMRILYCTSTSVSLTHKVLLCSETESAQNGDKANTPQLYIAVLIVL